MNRNLMLAVVVVVLAGVGFWLYSRSKSESLPDLAPVGANLIEGLGDYSMPVTSKNKDVQRWFDQGLAMTYGFNHDAAERSFLKAAELDPDCAMCWWGAALVLGPHVNAKMDPANNPKAWDRLQRAQKTADDANEKEQAFIKALSARYAENPPEDRRPLDEAYATAMAELAAKYPDDLDVVTFHAESMMDLQPWDYWDAAGQPKGTHGRSRLAARVRHPARSGACRRPALVRACGRGLDRSFEGRRRGRHAARAVARLRSPGPHAGAHLRARRPLSRRGNRKPEGDRGGRQLPCSLQAGARRLSARLRAAQPPLPVVRGDDRGRKRACARRGADDGREDERPEAHAHARLRGDAEFLADAAVSRMSRFGRWDEVVAAPKPADDLPYMQAMWNYAQGMAAVRQGRIEDAKRHSTRRWCPRRRTRRSRR